MAIAFAPVGGYTFKPTYDNTPRIKHAGGAREAAEPDKPVDPAGHQPSGRAGRAVAGLPP